jgi:hypothetical protein
MPLIELFWQSSHSSKMLLTGLFWLALMSLLIYFEKYTVTPSTITKVEIAVINHPPTFF